MQVLPLLRATIPLFVNKIKDPQDHSDWNYFFQCSRVLSNQWYIIIIFQLPDFSLIFQFSNTEHKIPWHFPVLNEFFFPDHFLTCGNHGMNLPIILAIRRQIWQVNWLYHTCCHRMIIERTCHVQSQIWQIWFQFYFVFILWKGIIQSFA